MVRRFLGVFGLLALLSVACALDLNQAEVDAKAQLAEDRALEEMLAKLANTAHHAVDAGDDDAVDLNSLEAAEDEPIEGPSVLPAEPSENAVRDAEESNGVGDELTGDEYAEEEHAEYSECIYSNSELSPSVMDTYWCDDDLANAHITMQPAETAVVEPVFSEEYMRYLEERAQEIEKTASESSSETGADSEVASEDVSADRLVVENGSEAEAADDATAEKAADVENVENVAFIQTGASKTFKSDHYTDCERLGQGSFGIVYKCNTPDRQTVAVKEYKLRKQRPGEKANWAQRVAEAQAEADTEWKWGHQLFTNNNFCVPVNDRFYEQTMSNKVFLRVPHLVQEFGGMSMMKFQTAEKNGIVTLTPEGYTLFSDVSFHQKLSRELLEAIHYSTSLGIVHSDLKGDNVVYGVPAGASDPRVREIDYGMSFCVKKTGGCADFANSHDRSYKGGTPGYIPPEAWHGDVAQYTRVPWAFDVYSAGIMMMEWAMGADVWHHGHMYYFESGCASAPKALTFTSELRSVRPEEFARKVTRSTYQAALLAQNKHSAVARSVAFKDLLMRMLHNTVTSRPSPAACLSHVYFTNDGIPLECGGKQFWFHGKQYKACMDTVASAKKDEATDVKQPVLPGAHSKVPRNARNTGAPLRGQIRPMIVRCRAAPVPPRPVQKTPAPKDDDALACVTQTSDYKLENKCSYNVVVQLECKGVAGAGHTYVDALVRMKGEKKFISRWIEQECRVLAVHRR